MVYVLLFMSVLSIEYNRIMVFKEPIPDRVLPDHVIRTEKVLNEGGCKVKCFLEPKCVSINVGPGGAHTRTCKLSNATDESPSLSSLKKKKHYIHLQAPISTHKFSKLISMHFFQE